MRETAEEIRFWALSSGRVFFLSSVLKNAVFAAFADTLAYKVFLLALNLACAACFLAYARLLSPGRAVPVAALLALPVLIQFRDYHDPVISFNGIFQLTLALIFAALAFHALYLRSGEARWVRWCVAAFVANLFLYEIAVLTVPLLWLQERLLRAGAPRPMRVRHMLLAILVVYAVLVLAARAIGATVYGYGSSYGLSLDAGLVAPTLAKQLIAVVPFSYFLFRPRNGAWGIDAPPDPAPWLGTWQFFAMAPVFVAIAWLALRAAARGEAPPRAAPSAPDALFVDEGTRTLAAIAAALFLLPALVVSVLGRYQNAFGPGNGYSLVYLQEYGAALGVAVLVFGMARAPGVPRWRAIAYCLVLGVASAGNLVNNRAVAHKLDRAWSAQYPFVAMLRSEEFGALCRDVPVAIPEWQPWGEYRVIGNAGFRFATPELLAAARTGGGEACVVRLVPLAGRSAIAYARVRSPGAPQAEMRSPVHVVAPTGDRKERGEPRAGAAVPDAVRQGLLTTKP